MSSTRDFIRYLRPLVTLFTLIAAAFAQKFAQPTVIPTGNWPTAIYAADVNGDGYSDLIYIDQGATPNQPSTTHVLLNDGKGNFTQSAVLATSGNSIAIGNLAGTSHVDIGWISSAPDARYADPFTATLYIAAGRGDGTFAPGASAAVAGQAGTAPHRFGFLIAGRLSPLASADVLAEDLGSNSLFIFNSANIYTGSVGSAVVGTAGPITVVDVNGDGHNDVVLNDQSANTVHVLIGSGLSAPQLFTPSGATQSLFTGVHSLLVQDVTFDGIPDLIAEGAAGRIDVFPGNGDGTFQTQSFGGTGTLDGTTGNGGHLIAIADLNHDGLPDALAVTPIGLSALLGNGTAYLGLNGIYNAGPTGGSGHPSYITADFNNDGNLDLAVDSPEGIAILFGNPDGSFQTSLAFAAGQPAMSAATGVFTSSGNVDAVVAYGDNGTQFLHGNGDGTFAYNGSPGAPAPITTPNGVTGRWSTLQVGDFNGDGALDFALTEDGPAALLPVFYGGLYAVQGNNTDHPTSFEYVTPTADGFCAKQDIYFGQSVAADFLGNGTSVLANRDQSALHLVTGGHGTSLLLEQSHEVAPACNLHAHDLIATGDLNNDGTPDLLIESDGHMVEFTLVRDALASGQSSFIVDQTIDLSIDGALNTPGQRLAPDISRTFPGHSNALGFNAFPGSAAIADLDGDGNSDILIAYANLSADRTAPTPTAPNYLYIWYGSGSGRFLISAKHPVNPIRLTLSRNYYQVAIADLNQDGIPDLILSDGYLLSIQLGLGDGTFGPETHFLAGQGLNTISVADLNHDGKLDLLLANGGTVFTNPVANLDTLTPNPDVSTGGITVLLSPVTPLVTLGGTVIANPEPSPYGSSFIISATLNKPTGGVTPTGTVTFSIDGVLIGTTAPGSFTTAEMTSTSPNTLAIGSHILTASYSGDSNYTSVSLTGTHAVLGSTTATLTASPEPSPYGNGFSITTTFAAPATGNPAPTGTVSIFVDGQAAGTAPLSGLFATINVPSNIYSTLTPGSHTLSGTYSGDTNYSPNSTLAGTHAVALIPTTATLTATPEPSPYSSAFSITTTFATPATGDPAPTGTVSFAVDGISIGSAPITGLSATLTVPATIYSTLNPGSHTLSATYSGDSNYTPVSASGTHAVALITATATLTASPQLSPYGSGFSITTTLAAPAPGSLTPTGIVSFAVDGISIGSAPISSLSATLTVPATIYSTLNPGSHTLSATYSGDSNYNPVSASGTHAVALIPATATLTASPQLSPYGSGFSITTTLAAPAPGSPTPTGTVSFAIDGISIGSAPISALSATLTVPATIYSTLNPGSHTLSAIYSGDPNYTPVSASGTHAVALIPTTATLTASPQLSPYGSAFSITDTLAAPAPGSLTPTGTVSFSVDGISIGSTPISALSATLTVPATIYSTLNPGSHTLSATYSGDPNYTPVSASGTHAVALITATATLTAAPEPSTYSNAFTVTAAFAVTAPGSPTPTGTVTFAVDGKAAGSAPVTALSATLTVPATIYSTLNPGSHTLSATYSGDPNYTPVSASGTHAVALIPTTATLTAAPEPSTYSNAFTVTAAFAVTAPGSPTPTGTVTFAVDGKAAGSAPITGLSATLTVPASIYSTLAIGSHTLTGTYSGDTNYSPNSTLAGTHAVALLPTTLSLVLCVDAPGSNFPCAANISSSPLVNPVSMYYGQVLDGAATESETDLTGTLNFYSGTSIFCTLTANLAQGTNTCPPTSGIFSAGSSTVYAAYSGDSTHAASTSNSILVNVLPDITTATLTSSLNPSNFGQSVTITASVQGNFAPGAGPVMFYDGTTLLATLTLDPTGHATYTTSTLAVGTHPLRVVFPASSNFSAASSLILNQVVNPLAPTALSLSSSVNPSAFAQTVTFTATLALAGATPTGSITFMDGASLLASSPINSSGVAVFSISTLAVGSHPITATYIAPPSTIALTSPVFTQIVTGANGFTLNITPVPVTLGVGRTAILLVSVSEGAGYSQPVELTCSGLPPESSCTFIQPVIPAGGASTTLNFSISAPRDCGTNTPYFLGASGIPPSLLNPAAPAAALACVLFLPIFRRRKLLTRSILLSLFALAAFTTLSGCGHCTDLGTRPGTYSFTVTATPQGGSFGPQSQTIPLTVIIP